MVDLASIQDGMTSWYGLGGALAAGAVLGLLIGPRYKVDPNPALDQLAGPNRRPLGASLRQLRRALIDKAVSTGFKPRGTSGVVLVVDEITGSLKQPIVFTAYTVALGLALIIYLHINGTTIV